MNNKFTSSQVAAYMSKIGKPLPGKVKGKRVGRVSTPTRLVPIQPWKLDDSGFDGVTILTPIPPSVNHLWANVGNGRRIKSREGKQYSNSMVSICRAAQIRPVGIPCKITIYLWNSSMDIDNCLKCVLDALQGAIVENDSQFQSLLVYRRNDDGLARMEINMRKDSGAEWL